MELIFEVRDAEEGGYYARALGHAIFTEAETWEELRANVLEATTLHFEDGPVHPRLVQTEACDAALTPGRRLGIELDSALVPLGETNS
jgi:predicted RNase H-like HicB family nuclease